ncbi:MAG: TetR/AcrR family transcriptional regulator [Planctomycetes bacterium]|nr:TetR/AcrR family transcriptional regulator [Planctomycetota bacterium]
MAAEKLDTEIRREQIAEAALQLLGTHGIRQLSVAAVAEQVGLVPSAIYRHFEGKEEVLGAVLELIGERLMANVEAVCREWTGSLERLERLLDRHVQLIRENQAIPRVMFSDEMAGGDSRRKAKTYETIRTYLRGVAKIVRQGQKAGEIRSDVQADAIAMLFVGIIQPGAVLWHLSDGQFDITRHAKRTWRLYRDAIVA